MAKAEDHLSVLGGNTAEMLAGFVARVERLQGDIDDLNTDKRGIFAEVRACGFNSRVLRRLIQRRRLDRQDRIDEDDILDMYEAALEGARTGGEGDPLTD